MKKEGDGQQSRAKIERHEERSTDVVLDGATGILVRSRE